MYIYDFLKALQLYSIDTSRFPKDVLYLGIYSYDDIIQKNIPHQKKHQSYLVYVLHDNLYAMDIDEEMKLMHHYQNYSLILSHKATLHLDEAILEGLRLYDEFVTSNHLQLQYPSQIYASMLTGHQPGYAYFDYNPMIYQFTYERLLYFIKMYCYYRLKTDRQGYPVKNFNETFKSILHMYHQKDHETYHIYTLTHIENKEFDLFLSQVSKNDGK